MFQRIHNRNSYEGHGIGLTICRRIVENHGGKLYATSIEHQGTTFYILFPVKQINWATIHLDC
ncbi:ATP-binding protein [Spirosoma migulaei]